LKTITGLSLFSGVDVARMAAGELGLDVDWYSSEIDKYAIQGAKALYDGTTYLGDMTKWDEWEDEKGFDFSKVDIIFAGFPCQAWSLAGKQKGDDDPRGALVHDLLDIYSYISALNPNVKFMFENVAMKKEFMSFINELFGCNPTMINSALLTAQNRKRNYWSNWEISQPEDMGILLKDIIEGGAVDRDKSLCITTRIAGATAKRYLEKSQHQMVIDDKTIMTDTFTNRQKGNKCLVDEPKDKAASPCAMEYVKNGRQGDYLQCDNDGNQTVFRPCELRDTTPLFEDWFKATKDYGGSLEEYNRLYKKPLCHHVATATDIKSNEANKRVYADTGKSPTVTTMGGGHREPKVLMKSLGRGFNKGFEKEVDKTGTLTKNSWEQNNKLSVDGAKYRKLTPRECMRLQGFTEEIVDKLLNAGISNSQLYKMTGNSFTLPVIIHNIQCLLDKGWMQS
jgi:DNA (cytosine-5)-methyltransferase 1/DNA (cytosine-5)-methyltransferase 3A